MSSQPERLIYYTGTKATGNLERRLAEQALSILLKVPTEQSMEP